MTDPWEVFSRQSICSVMIAFKVIKHHGDEVLDVFDIRETAIPERQ